MLISIYEIVIRKWRIGKIFWLDDMMAHSMLSCMPNLDCAIHSWCYMFIISVLSIVHFVMIIEHCCVTGKEMYSVPGCEAQCGLVGRYLVGTLSDRSLLYWRKSGNRSCMARAPGVHLSIHGIARRQSSVLVDPH